MNLNESIIKIRVELQNSKLKKSGENKYAGFKYFELADFLPRLNELMLEEKINDRFFIKDDYAVLELQKGEEINTYTMPFIMFDTPTSMKADKTTGEIRETKQMQDIQYLGALTTYYKRYLYMNAYGITDGEVIDSMNNEDLNNTKKSQNATPKQIELLNKYYQGENLDKLLEANKIKSLEELPMKKASEIIGAIMKKGNN